MPKTNLRSLDFFVFLAEIGLVYGGLVYLHIQGFLTLDLFFLSLSFASLVFSLYYGIKGALAAVFCCGGLLFYVTEYRVLPFLSLHYREAGFLLAALLITGFAKTSLERRAIGADLANLILNRRVEKLTLDLSEKDRALQDAFREVLTDMESPRIMYQAMRRIQGIGEKETLLEEILYVLYVHCHVEKSGIYEVLKTGVFQRVASFGGTDLPEILKWKSEVFPEILRVAAMEKEVIVPREMNNRLVMAVPVLSRSQTLRYLILIEEIRFINLSEKVINLLKVSAFWIKSLIENRLFMDELLPLSVFPSTLVYRREVSRGRLRDQASAYRKYRLPFALLGLKGELTETEAANLSSCLRLYDEIFLLGDREYVAFLSMASEANAGSVLQRLKDRFPGMDMTLIKETPSAHG